MNSPIYLNCAASAWPRPKCVTDAVTSALEAIPSESSRSSFRGPSVSDACRLSLSKLLNCDAEDIHFSSGATESANLIINGLSLDDCHVIATAAEHNCVFRPLYNHPAQPEVSIVPCDKDGRVSVADLEAMIRPDTKYLFLNHCSNVSGCVQDLAAIARIAQMHGLRLIVDASQSIGCIPLDLRSIPIDVLFFAGHKNLFGPTGIGGFYLRKDMPFRISKTGGTGSDSLWLRMPEGYKNLEPGTANLQGLAGLAAGAEFIQSTGLSHISNVLQNMRHRLVEGLSSIDGVHVFNPAPKETAAPVVSFLCEGFSPSDISYILAESYGIILRSGYHCCPLLSPCLGAAEGTVRASFSYLTEPAAIDKLVLAVGEIMEAAR